jgi:hypothetical protein
MEAVVEHQPLVLAPAGLAIGEAHPKGVGQLGEGLLGPKAPGVAGREVLHRRALRAVDGDAPPAVEERRGGAPGGGQIGEDLEHARLEVDHQINLEAVLGAVPMPGGKAGEVDPVIGQRAGIARSLEHGPEQGGGVAGRARDPALRAGIPVGQDAADDAVQLVDHAGELVGGLDADRGAGEPGKGDRLLGADGAQRRPVHLVDDPVVVGVWGEPAQAHLVLAAGDGKAQAPAHGARLTGGDGDGAAIGPAATARGARLGLHLHRALLALAALVEAHQSAGEGEVEADLVGLGGAGAKPPARALLQQDALRLLDDRVGEEGELDLAGRALAGLHLDAGEAPDGGLADAQARDLERPVAPDHEQAEVLIVAHQLGMGEGSQRRGGAMLAQDQRHRRERAGLVARTLEEVGGALGGGAEAAQLGPGRGDQGVDQEASDHADPGSKEGAPDRAGSQHRAPEHRHVRHRDRRRQHRDLGDDSECALAPATAACGPDADGDAVPRPGTASIPEPDRRLPVADEDHGMAAKQRIGLGNRQHLGQGEPGRQLELGPLRPEGMRPGDDRDHVRHGARSRWR